MPRTELLWMFLIIEYFLCCLFSIVPGERLKMENNERYAPTGYSESFVTEQEVRMLGTCAT